MKEEQFLREELRHTVKVPLIDLEPYFHADPWSMVLEHKRVLVVHPFAESIKSQYARRELLFNDPRVLPHFELITLKAVQTMAHNPSSFRTWFDALADMKEKIEKSAFDVAIIGCGAYGLPLAAYVKRTGRQAVHLGGATQLLFGIKGQRWEEREQYQQLMNENWIKPLESERPKNYLHVEGGCYW
jgi:hypothetical protein